MKDPWEHAMDRQENEKVQSELTQLRARVRELEMLLEGADSTYKRIAEIVGDRGQYRDLEEAVTIHITNLEARALHAEGAHLKANARIRELEEAIKNHKSKTKELRRVVSLHSSLRVWAQLIREGLIGIEDAKDMDEFAETIEKVMKR